MTTMRGDVEQWKKQMARKMVENGEMIGKVLRGWNLESSVAFIFVKYIINNFANTELIETPLPISTNYTKGLFLFAIVKW